MKLADLTTMDQTELSVYHNGLLLAFVTAWKIGGQNEMEKIAPLIDKVEDTIKDRIRKRGRAK